MFTILNFQGDSLLGDDNNCIFVAFMFQKKI